MRPTADGYLDAFKDQGFVVIPNLFPLSALTKLNDLFDRLVLDRAESQGAPFFCNLIEKSPDVVLPLVINPTLLQLTEAIIGPFAQLDSTCLVGSYQQPAEMKGHPVEWHRDRFAIFPNGMYQIPRVLLIITYLQPLDDDIGPLRVIPRSHRIPVEIFSSEARAPHADEELLKVQIGHAVLIHHSLLHSGTYNVSPVPRRFFGIALNHTFMRQQDDFSGAICMRIKAWARKRKNLRFLRLLGEDKQLDFRLNSGALSPESESWRNWSMEDGPVEACQEVLEHIQEFTHDHGE